MSARLCTAEVERLRDGIFGGERVVEECGRPAFAVLDSPGAARCVGCLEANPEELDEVDETLATDDSESGQQRLIALHLHRIADAAKAGARSKPDDRRAHMEMMFDLCESLRAVAKDLLPKRLRKHA